MHTQIVGRNLLERRNVETKQETGLWY